MKTPLRSPSQAAFSLVELLVVIAVMGTMAAIAIPTLANVSQQAQVNRDQKNAQALAAVAGAAQAAGATIDTSSLDNAIQQLQSGVHGTGVFGSSLFKAAPLEPDQLQNITSYLSISGNSLVYTQQ